MQRQPERMSHRTVLTEGKIYFSKFRSKFPNDYCCLPNNSSGQIGAQRVLDRRGVSLEYLQVIYLSAAYRPKKINKPTLKDLPDTAQTLPHVDTRRVCAMMNSLAPTHTSSDSFCQSPCFAERISTVPARRNTAVGYKYICFELLNVPVAWVLDFR